MKSFCLLCLALLFLGLLAFGCTRMVMPVASSMIPGFTRALFEECDVQLAKTALPAELKLMEGLLKNDPDNARILKALCMGFTGYALLFVEDEDPERASSLYLRARGYGFRVMGFENIHQEQMLEQLKNMSHPDIQGLFWTTMAWNAWINLNLDKPSAVGESALAQACLQRILEINPDYFHGTPLILMGALLAARPPMLGGDPDKARICFEKALALTESKFLLAQYYLARYYAVRVQNRELFNQLVKTVAATNPNDLKEVCLINQMAKHKMAVLAEMENDLFL